MCKTTKEIRFPKIFLPSRAVPEGNFSWLLQPIVPNRHYKFEASPCVAAQSVSAAAEGAATPFGFAGKGSTALAVSERRPRTGCFRRRPGVRGEATRVPVGGTLRHVPALVRRSLDAAPAAPRRPRRREALTKGASVSGGAVPGATSRLHSCRKGRRPLPLALERREGLRARAGASRGDGAGDEDG
jgi:hypothetical protein